MVPLEKTEIVCHHAKNPIRNNQNPPNALVHSSSSLLAPFKLIRFLYLWDEKEETTTPLLALQQCDKPLRRALIHVFVL